MLATGPFAPIPTIPPPAETDVFTPELAGPPAAPPLFPVTVPIKGHLEFDYLFYLQIVFAGVLQVFLLLA